MKEANKVLITKFYRSFQLKDYKAMQDSYAEDAVFKDEVFNNLDASQVRAMWEMLIKKGKDLELEFKNIKANNTSGSAEWTATYTFSSTKRKVVNHVKSVFILEKGKIVQQTDHFNFYSWAKQALGATGLLLGWTDFFKKKVQDKARQGLFDYIDRTKG